MNRIQHLATYLITFTAPFTCQPGFALDLKAIESPFSAAIPASAAEQSGDALEAALAKLRELVEQGRLTRDQLQVLRERIDSWATDASAEGLGICTLRERLQRHVAHMEELAGTIGIRLGDVAAFEQRVVDAKLDRYLLSIHERAVQGQVDRESYTQVVRLLHRRAELAGDGELALAIRARLLAAVDGLMQRGAGVVESVREARWEFIQVRLTESLARLQAQLAGGGATRAEYQVFAEALEDRARAMAGDLFPSCP